MRLDNACFVLAKPKVPTMTTRRAFLMAGSTFFVGACVGGACVHALGDAPLPAAPAEEVLAPSGDVELDELRRLAVKAPLAELVERAGVFVELTRRSYRTDAVLWRGMERLTNAVLTDVKFPNRRVFSRVLAQVIEGGDAAVNSGLLQKTKDLRAIQ
jgi:hypothetical protein